MSSINKAAVFAVFSDADNSSASFADRLMALGIADRETAKPLAMEWAAKKYKAVIEEGQRGAKLPRNSDAERAMYRVLDACFPRVDTAKPAAERSKSDPVAALVAKYAKLTAGEKRSFKAALAKL